MHISGPRRGLLDGPLEVGNKHELGLRALDGGGVVLPTAPCAAREGPPPPILSLHGAEDAAV
eukprot:764881-Lingulodinium_polyedra.AAC.1